MCLSWVAWRKLEESKCVESNCRQILNQSLDTIFLAVDWALNVQSNIHVYSSFCLSGYLSVCLSVPPYKIHFSTNEAQTLHTHLSMLSSAQHKLFQGLCHRWLTQLRLITNAKFVPQSKGGKPDKSTNKQILPPLHTDDTSLNCPVNHVQHVLEVQSPKLSNTGTKIHTKQPRSPHTHKHMVMGRGRSRPRVGNS